MIISPYKIILIFSTTFLGDRFFWIYLLGHVFWIVFSLMKKKPPGEGGFCLKNFLLYAGLLPDSAIPKLIWFLHNNDGKKIISNKDKQGGIEHY